MVMFQANKNSTSCKFADIEDFDEIQKLYWNLIEQSKGEPSFPGWKKGVHPSPEMIMESIKQKQMYILKANDVIKAGAICNHLSNEEYANVSWRIKDTGQIKFGIKRFDLPSFFASILQSVTLQTRSMNKSIIS